MMLADKFDPKSNISLHKKKHYNFQYEISFPSETEISVSSLFYYHLFAITFKNLFCAGTKVSRQSNSTVSVTMEAETQDRKNKLILLSQVIRLITPMDILLLALILWTMMLKLKTMKDG
jgi:hypothetical protein